MKAVVIRWLPWVLVAAALATFMVIPGADGPGLVLAWGAIVVAVRFGVALLPGRGPRLWVDGLLVLGCLLAAFEGGWYLLPAALAFTITDQTPECV